MRDRERLIDEAVAQTRRMLELAVAGDWQQVVALESSRRALLEQAFATRESLTETLASRVREILELDKVLLEASQRLRDEAGEELVRINQGRRASRAYRASA